MDQSGPTPASGGSPLTSSPPMTRRRARGQTGSCPSPPPCSTACQSTCVRCCPDLIGRTVKLVLTAVAHAARQPRTHHEAHVCRLRRPTGRRRRLRSSFQPIGNIHPSFRLDGGIGGGECVGEAGKRATMRVEAGDAGQIPKNADTSVAASRHGCDRDLH